MAKNDSESKDAALRGGIKALSEKPAKKYLLLKKPIVSGGAVEKHVEELREYFDWVEDRNKATRDYAPVMEDAKKKLKEQFDIETELEQVPNDKQPTPMFVLLKITS